MPTYKCKYCSHELVTNFCPIECEICGSLQVLPIQKFKSPTITQVNKDQVKDSHQSIRKLNIPDGIIGWNWGAFSLGFFYYSVHFLLFSQGLWNWGAFLLVILWSIDNRIWLGILFTIPKIGWIFAIVLGIKTNKWAWKNRKWTSVQQFKKHQRVWTIIGFIVYLIFIVNYFHLS